MEIDKDKRYEIIVFPNQDEGLKAQRILVSKGEDFKHISTLAVVVPVDRRQAVCRSIIDGNALISGYYPFFIGTTKRISLRGQRRIKQIVPMVCFSRQ